MSTLTPLGLKKPAITDYYDVADANGNMDLVDTLIGNNKTTADAKAILTKGTGTITTTGWVASATDYDFELTLSVSGILLR
jgi:transcriptional/translational regulatory protein YebC/TACO1